MAETFKKYIIKQKDNSGTIVELYPQIMLDNVAMENDDAVLSTAEVQKLKNLGNGAEVNNVTSISVNGVSCPISNRIATLPALATFGSDGKLIKSQAPVGYVDEIVYVADEVALAKVVPVSGVIYRLGTYGSDEAVQTDLLLRYLPGATAGDIAAKGTTGTYYYAIVSRALTLGTSASQAYSYFAGVQNSDKLTECQQLYNSYNTTFESIKADYTSLESNLSKIYTKSTEQIAVALASTANALSTKATLKISGDLTGSFSFDGTEHATVDSDDILTAGITANLSLKSDRVTAGSYCSANVDAKGFVSAGKYWFG